MENTNQKTAETGTDLILSVKRIKRLCMADEGATFENIRLLHDLERNLEDFIVSVMAAEPREVENG